MQVFVSFENGNTLEFDVKSSTTIEELKKMIQVKTEIFPELQILKKKEKILYYGKLEENKIDNNDTINLFQKTYEPEVCGKIILKLDVCKENKSKIKCKKCDSFYCEECSNFIHKKKIDHEEFWCDQFPINVKNM